MSGERKGPEGRQQHAADQRDRKPRGDERADGDPDSTKDGGTKTTSRSDVIVIVAPARGQVKSRLEGN
jgi:hypothetical protein